MLLSFQTHLEPSEAQKRGKSKYIKNKDFFCLGVLGLECGQHTKRPNLWSLHAWQWLSLMPLNVE